MSASGSETISALLQVCPEHVVEPVVDREKAGGLDAQRVRAHEGAQLGVVIARACELVLRRDVDGDRVPVLLR